jgi:transposase
MHNSWDKNDPRDAQVLLQQRRDSAVTVTSILAGQLHDGPGECIFVFALCWLVPGIGPIAASALEASAGNGHQFTNGRFFAAWLGLVPREYSTGGKTTLLGISNRGNAYLRRLLIHGARSCVQTCHRQRHPLGAWITRLEQRMHRNKVIVALANKIARVA